MGVLDVDSDRLNDFDETDSEGLGRIVRLVEQISQARGFYESW
jgi:putative methionine-R-sulfoxide reductase with GAF domain